MLDPTKRQNLIDLLRPPEGYLLDYAIGTTYSLDLMTLLTVPLAFTFFGAGTEVRRPDPLILLDGVRRYAQKLTVFCQAGQISVPREEQILYSYLESAVIEVTARSRYGVFHPKVWALRFVNDKSEDLEEDKPVLYRFICLSRNLTFDRSWDTVAVLDGRLTSRMNAIGKNHPLGEFYERLPGLALRDLKESIQKRIDQFAKELRRVNFKVPYPFEEYAFFPMGIKRGESWPFGARKQKLLVISPFLTHGFLERISADCNDCTLVSRIDGPNGLESFSADQLASFQKIYVFSENANVEEGDDNGEELHDIGATPFDPPLSGLHAKVYFAEQGGLERRIHLWTGSANATSAAIKHNVEFLLRFVGRERHLSIDKLLTDRKDQIDLRDLLVEYDPPAEAESIDETKIKLDQKLRRLKQLLFESEFSIEIASETNDDNYRLTLRWEGDDVDRVVRTSTVRCWPITIPRSDAVNLADVKDRQSLIGIVSIESITSFIAFEIEVKSGNTRVKSRFVLNLPLEKPPEKRRQRILSHLLSDKQSVLRYLMLLLMEGGDIYAAGSLAIKLIVDPETGNRTPDLLSSIHLFESLTTALADYPEILEQIRGLVDELVESGDEHLLPEGFQEIWEPIWEAYSILSSDTEPLNLESTATVQEGHDGET